MKLIEAIKNDILSKQIAAEEVQKNVEKAYNEYKQTQIENLKKEHAIMRRLNKDNELWETLLNDDEFVAYLHENDKTNQELK